MDNNRLTQAELTRLRQVWLHELDDNRSAIWCELVKPDDEYHSKKYLREKFYSIIHNLEIVKRIIEYKEVE